jgi:hypothetical protein
MDIEGTAFGTITIDGKTYDHDVIIRLSGEVVKRKKKTVKKSTTARHTCFRKTERQDASSSFLAPGKWAMCAYRRKPRLILQKKGCKVLLRPTPQAIHLFNRSHAKKVGLFRVTC